MDAPDQQGEPSHPDGRNGRASKVVPLERRATKCPCCGRHCVVPLGQPGRVLRYRNSALTLPADLLVPTCRRCRHQILSFEAVPELQARLEATYRADLCERASVEIARLNRRYSQHRVEVALDLSQGYLSRLRAKDGVPSAALVSLLALLAAEPTRLEELRRYWDLPVGARLATDDGKVLR